MMKVVDVAPKDIYITIELSLKETRNLLKALDKVKIDYNGQKEPEMVEAAQTLTTFYNILAEVEDGLPKHSGT